MNQTTSKSFHQALSGTLFALALVTTPLSSHAQTASVEDFKSIAEEGFIYGLPLVMNYAGGLFGNNAAEANWLPAPSDTVYLVIRLYWPKTEAPSILPPGEGAWKPPGIVKVQ